LADVGSQCAPRTKQQHQQQYTNRAGWQQQRESTQSEPKTLFGDAHATQQHGAAARRSSSTAQQQLQLLVHVPFASRPVPAANVLYILTPKACL